MFGLCSIPFTKDTKLQHYDFFSDFDKQIKVENYSGLKKKILFLFWVVLHHRVWSIVELLLVRPHPN